MVRRVPTILTRASVPMVQAMTTPAGDARVKAYRKKPVVIEAMEWTGQNTDALFLWIDADTDPPCVSAVHAGEHGRRLEIDTLEGVMTAQPGDWIIKGVNSEFYPCKPDIFEATYEHA